MTRIALLTTTLILLLTGQVWAVAPVSWRTTGVEGWSEAERESVGVTSEGEVGMALATVPSSLSEAFTVWDLLRDGENVLAATGDGGVLYRIDSSGEATEVARVVQPQITALGRDGNDRVLLGTAPDGVVYVLGDGGAVSVADCPETYVWAIAPASKGGAVVATGGAGKLYHLDRDGELELLADPGAEHVTGLIRVEDGYLAATESPGRLLHVTASGTMSVLHDAEEPELRSPVRAADGSVYFLANPLDPKGAGRLYRWSPEGSVERLWSALEGFVYEVVLAEDGSLWVTTGSDDGRGSVVRVDPGPPSAWMEMARVDEPQILCALLDDGEGRWLGTGGLGRVYRIPGGDAGRGMATSPAHDAGGLARWGAVALEPGYYQDGLSVETRSGNTREPDGTWSDWAEVTLKAGRGPVPSPAARFLQWRLGFEDPAARLGGLDLRYLPANRAPRVSRVEVAEPGATLERSWDAGQPGSLVQELPGGVRAEFQVSNGRGASRGAEDSETAWARRYRAVTWTASDPNDDALRFQVDIKQPGEASWTPLAVDLEASPWIWDSAAVPDGWYLLRVTASDAVANPPRAEATAHRISRPVLVDNTAPRLMDLAVSDGVLTGSAVDETGPIRKLEMAVNGGAWITVFPEDGIPDMPRESIRVTLDDMEPGDAVVLVRAVDQAGNIGTGRVGFRVR